MQSNDIIRQGMNLVDPFVLPEEYSRMRAGAPISRVRCPGGIDAWLVTRHADVCTVLANTRFSSRVALFDHLFGTLDHVPKNDDSYTDAFFRLDGAAHLRIRRALGPEFSTRGIRKFNSQIEDIVTARLEVIKAAGPPVDLYHEFAIPVTSAVMFKLLGAPRERQKWFQEGTRAMLDINTPVETLMHFPVEINDYMRDLVACKRREAKDDLMSRLIHKGANAEKPFTDDELATTCGILLSSGLDTTASVISLSVLALLRHPQQLAEFRANHHQIRQSVEELLRYVPLVVSGIARYATEDNNVGDQQIRAGDWVIAALVSANRDETLCDRPDRLELTRNPTRHVAFGHGPHQCIGQLLARAEIEIALRELFKRFPRLRLAVPLDQVRLRSDTALSGVQALPVTW